MTNAGKPRTAIIMMLSGGDVDSRTIFDEFLHYTIAGLRAVEAALRPDVWVWYKREEAEKPTFCRWKNVWSDDLPREFKLHANDAISDELVHPVNGMEDLPTKLESFLRRVRARDLSQNPTAPNEEEPWGDYDHVYTIVGAHGESPEGFRWMKMIEESNIATERKNEIIAAFRRSDFDTARDLFFDVETKQDNRDEFERLLGLVIADEWGKAMRIEGVGASAIWLQPEARETVKTTASPKENDANPPVREASAFPVSYSVSLPTSDLNAAMKKAGLSASRCDPGNVEVVILHSCRMSTVETAYELRNRADAMIACQPDLAGSMFVDFWLGSLARNHSPQQIAEHCFDTLKLDQTPPACRNVSGLFTCLDLSEIEAVVFDLDQLGTRLNNIILIQDLVAIVVAAHKDSETNYGFVDASILSQLLAENFFSANSTNPESLMVGHAATQLRGSLDRLLITHKELVNPPARTATRHYHLRGVSLYFPHYDESDWAKLPDDFASAAPNWVEFLNKWKQLT